MNIYKFLLFTLILTGLIFSCSKKKEDAAKLEQEMLQQEVDSNAIRDSIQEMEAVMDSLAETEESMEVSEEAVMPGQPEGEGYTIQIASCEDRTYAEYLINKYLERGYEAYMTTITYDGQTYYRVRIGLFEALSDARLLEDELEDKYSKDVWIDITAP
ncbi:MAG: SPOR domain-containing protein [Candidatus Zixiibacteriota bacterium]